MGKPVATPFQTQVLENHHEDYEGWRVYAIRSAENIHLATVGGVDRYHQDEYADIANLFRAAPDLLAACEAALENLRLWEDEDDNAASAQMPSPLRDKLESAIARAKGES